MKGIYRKNSRLSKIIALWLVLVMIVTPLMSYVGEKTGAKAEASDSLPYISIPAISVAGQVTKDAEGNYSFASTPITDTIYFSTKDSCTVDVNNAVADAASVTFGEGIDGQFISLEATTVTKVNGETNTAVSNCANFSNGEKVVVNVTVKFKDGEAEQTASGKIAEYTVTMLAALDNVTWSKTSESGDYCASLQPSGVAAEYTTAGKLSAGVVKYAVADYINGKNSYNDYKNSLAWSAQPQTKNTTGSYIGFVGYFEKEGSDNLIDVKTLSNFKVDTTKPVVSEGKVYSSSNNFANKTEIAAGTIVRTDVNYRYYFKAADSDSGINTLEVKKNGIVDASIVPVKAGNSYYFDFVPEASAPVYSVVAKDKVGNPSDELTLYSIEAADENKADIKAYWNSNKNNQTINVITKNKNKLTVEAESYTKVDEIVVDYKVNGVAGSIANKVTSDRPSTSIYYHYVTDFELPKDADNIELSEISVHMYGVPASGQERGAEVGTGKTGIGHIAYDKTEPVVEWDNSSNYVTPGNTWYLTEKKARFTIKSGDSNGYESNLASASYIIDGVETVIPVDGTSVAQVINITNSKSKAGTIVQIKAKDIAGNSYNQEFKFYVDSIGPELVSYYISDYDYRDENITVNSSPALEVEFKDNIELQSIKFEVVGSAEYVYSTDNIKDNKIKIDFVKNLLKGSELSGKYSVKVVAFDINGNKSAESVGTFTFDSDAPTATYRFVHKKKGDDWNTAEVVKGVKTVEDVKVYYINKSLDTDEYAFEVKASDAISVINESKLSDGSWYSIDKGTDASDGLFYIVINKSKLEADNAKSLEAFRIYDKAGNYIVESFEPIIYAVDSNIEFKARLLDENKKTIELTDDVKATLAAGTNKQYYVKVSAEGSNAFSDVYLADSKGAIKDVKVTVEKDNKYTWTKRYQYVATFALPVGAELSDRYKDLKAVATDGENTVSQSLLTLLYDATKPVVVNSVADHSIYEPPTGWLSELNFDVAVLSGLGSKESKLVSATYSVDSDDPVSFDIDGSLASMETLSLDDSFSTKGTLVSIYAKDDAGNDMKKSYRFYVDGTKPTIDAIVIGGKEDFSIPLTGVPKIETIINDNLTLKKAVIEVTYPDNKTVKTKTVNYDEDAGLINGNSVDFAYSLEKLHGNSVPDGHYNVKVSVWDKAGNKAVKNTSFDIDNTVPVVKAELAGGTVSEKNSTYYRSDVSVNLYYKEKNPDLISVTDNDNEIPVEWSDEDDKGFCVATVNLVAEGPHTVKINVVDKSGHRANEKQVYFVIDKTLPLVSLSVNGLPYVDGSLDITADVTVAVGITDRTYSDLYYQMIVTKPDQPTMTSEYVLSDLRSFTFSAEGDYTMNVYAVDASNNKGPVRSVTFRIDKTEPAITVSGITNGGSASVETTAGITINEAFWWDSEAKLELYYRAGDGASESLTKTMDVKLTGASTSVSELFDETGTYRIQVLASDRVGHKVETSQTFTIDKDSPEIKLDGIKNYDVLDGEVDFSALVSDAFFNSKTVNVEGTRTDINGKVNPIKFSPYYANGNPTIIEEHFAEDGIYAIKIDSADSTGNTSSEEMRFTVDKTAPEIGDLSKYDNTVLTSFKWDIDLDELVSDLTVCDVHMYLNGSEYDGKSEVADGSYTLLITAEDELGHYVEKSVAFVLDTKAPVFIVTGVEDNEVKNEAYSIDVSLQLDDDILSYVKLNGEDISLFNNEAHIDVEQKGNYSLTMEAYDKAGNAATRTIDFRYGNKNTTLIIIIIITASTILAGGIVFGVVRLRKRK